MDQKISLIDQETFRFRSRNITFLNKGHSAMES